MNNSSSSIPLYKYNSIDKKKEVVQIKYPVTSNTKGHTSSFNNNLFYKDSIIKANRKTDSSGFTKRKIVDNYYSDKFPYNANVKLKVYINGIEHNASGTLISKNIVLTSGHVIYSNKYSWTDSIIVISNYSNKSYSLQTKSYLFYVFKTYVEQSNMKYDLGLLILEDKIGEKTGFLGIGYNNDNSFYTQSGFFYHLSYPSKSFIPSEKDIYTGENQFINFGKFDKYIEKFDWVRYFQSAPKGESGSSFWSFTKSNYIVFGVLSMGISSYVLITKEKFNTIKKIIEINE